MRRTSTRAGRLVGMVNGKQYVAVTVGWKDTPGELIALALP